MRLSRRRTVALSILCSLLVLTAVIFHATWLTWLGSMLVYEQKPIPADIIEVLGGDLRGNRILVAAKLAAGGYAPVVLVSGAGDLYGQDECDLAVAFAVRQGFDEKLFVRLRYPADSTRDEAHAVVREFRKRGVKSYLLVTSNFHTRRAAAIFHREAPDLSFHVVGAPDLYFTPDGWWKNREAEKTFVGEWTKTVANWFGI